MALKMLVAAYGKESQNYVQHGREVGVDVRILDCLESYHRMLKRWFGDAILHVPGKRGDVAQAVAGEHFDVAVIQDDEDFVRTALITQALREAGIPRVYVVTSEAERRTMFRRLGAHRVLVSNSVDEAWSHIASLLPRPISAAVE